MQINEIKNLCQRLGIRPSKSLGQNFLICDWSLEKIIAAAELKPTDNVLEIGPGFGILTEELVKRAGRVVAVEKDRVLSAFAKATADRLKIKNLEIINEDILKLSVKDIFEQNTGSLTALRVRSGRIRDDNCFKIVSNLPYQITSPILWKFLHEDPIAPKRTLPLVKGETVRPELMVLMVQKEVGERICAQPGEMSVLSVMCQFYAECEKVAEVPRSCFWPEPEVDSAIIKLKTQITKHKDLDEKGFMRLVKIGFAARRKMLKNNLNGGFQAPTSEMAEILKKASLDEKIRAQELSVADWLKVFAALKKKKLFSL